MAELTERPAMPADACLQLRLIISSMVVKFRKYFLSFILWLLSWISRVKNNIISRFCRRIPACRCETRVGVKGLRSPLRKIGVVRWMICLFPNGGGRARLTHEPLSFAITASPLMLHTS